MSKKNAPYIAIISFLIIGILLFGISYFFNSNQNDKTRINARIYFRTDSNAVEYEEYPIQIQDNKEMVREVLGRFMAGPKKVNLLKTMPAGLKILDHPIIRIVPDRTTDSVFVINFSKEYYNMTPEEEMFFRATLTWTMTDLDFINNVEIRVENKERIDSAGTPMGLQNRQNVDIYGVLVPFSATVKLYFADAAGTKLLQEERVIDVDPRLPIEQYIVEQIIKGPQEDGHFPTVSPDVTVRDVQKTEGICFVNLSADFLSKGPVLPVTDEAAVYSIVDSLMEATGVKKVQFLIDSEYVGIFKGNIDLNHQFERNNEIIGDPAA